MIVMHDMSWLKCIKLQPSHLSLQLGNEPSLEHVLIVEWCDSTTQHWSFHRAVHPGWVLYGVTELRQSGWVVDDDRQFFTPLSCLGCAQSHAHPFHHTSLVHGACR